MEFDDLLTRSDVISLHMPLLDSTRHMINKDTIGKMRDGVILINCSRGELMDIEALVEGVETQKIGLWEWIPRKGKKGSSMRITGWIFCQTGTGFICISSATSS